jgi:hypothetical protein
MQSPSTLALAVAAALAVFGCDELRRGPADPKPPKAVVTAPSAATTASRLVLPAVHD